MREKRRLVFYCDFCKKHGMSRPAMEKHELHCTMNPDRACRWSLLDDIPSTRRVAWGGDDTHKMRRGLPRWVQMFAPLTETVLARLREHAQDCPACMLAAVRQSGLDIFARDGFNYDEEVKRYREDEHRHWEYEERREIESSWL